MNPLRRNVILGIETLVRATWEDRGVNKLTLHRTMRGEPDQASHRG